MAYGAILLRCISRMDLIQGYVDPDLNMMTKQQLIGLVGRIINLIENDRELSERVFHYTPAEMDEFILRIHAALSARQESRLHMIQLVEALYGDPTLRELNEASMNISSQRIHKRARYAKHGGRRKTRRRASRRRRKTF